MKYCIYCGSANKDEVRFCTSCGRPMDASEAPANPPVTHSTGADSKNRQNGHGGIIRAAMLALLFIALLSTGIAAFLLRDTLGSFFHEHSISDMDEVETTTSGDNSVANVTPADINNAADDPVVMLTFMGNGASQGTMSPVECKLGESFQLPKCGFTKDGYTFECWETDDKRQFAPGDSILPSEDMTFSAVWKPEEREEQNDPGAANTTSPAASFPREWSGTYTGYSQYVEGGTINRTLRITLSSVTEDGKLEGICYIGANDPDAGTGSYYVEGTVDWNTGAISLHGTKWYKQEDVKYMRVYNGTLSSSFDRITGTCAFEDGSRSGAWDMRSSS